MNISVLKEIKLDENRVALQPSQVKELIEMGHKVFIEMNAGVNAGFDNSEYEIYGATIVEKEEALKSGKLILKVKAPLPQEYDDYDKKHILFTYLHFDENIAKEEILKLISSGFTGIAYEWVGDNGFYPLLNPMSRLTGYLFAQKSSELLSRHKGILAGAYEEKHLGARVFIIGLGTIGLSAFQYFYQNGSRIVLLDKHPETVNERLNKKFNTKNICYSEEIEVIKFNTQNPLETKEKLDKEINMFDIILNCAVRRKDLGKERLEYLIDLEMIKKMKKGSVICDTTACDKDLIETAISSSKLEYIDIIEDIIHYNCDHIPSLVANTSTKLLSDETFKFISDIANKGFNQAIEENRRLRNGVSCKDGFITHLYSSEKKNMSQYYKTIEEIIK